MIISHRYRFIFIKTSKTAGTSVEIALSRFCGPDDIITPISRVDENLRRRLGHRGPQHYLAPLGDYQPRDYARLLLGIRKKRFFNHISAKRIRAELDPSVWEGYYKFCVERNPWDRLVSLYYWRCKSGNRPSMAEFLDSEVPLALKNNGANLYRIDGEIVVDRVCRYENLAEELEAVRLHLGIPEPLELPRAKGQFRKDKRSYREIFGEAERARIAELFSDEIALLGYEF